MKAKANQKVGNKIFYKDEPVIYFDTLKTSSMEGAATTVYAQGGRGNARLVAWEGERTVTFTMEDALISPAGFMILSGAGLTEASATETIKQHITETTDAVAIAAEGGVITVKVQNKPYQKAGENFTYVMLMNGDEVVSEPFIPETVATEAGEDGLYELKIKTTDTTTAGSATAWKEGFANGVAVLVDYYTERTSGAQQIDITPDKFGGNYYLEASTLFRDTNGVDMPAEFIIPNCKIQSNFTFTMASSGDPSTFTFTMDAFPDYTRFNKTKKVLAAIQIISTTGNETELVREKTQTARVEDKSSGMIVEK